LTFNLPYVTLLQINGEPMKFDSDIDKVWMYKLSREVTTIRREIENKLGCVITSPLITIFDMTSLWGQWCPSDRTIKISIRLIRNYEWGAVKHVLRHEFAHLIVDEVFKMSMPGVSHGEAFQKACDALGIDADRCASHEYLSTYKTSEGEGVVDKVRKLLVKGNCISVNKTEADLFLNKAREIMVRHNISMSSVCGNDRFCIIRPVGPLYKKTPRYTSILRDIVEEYYFVKTIGTYAYVNINGRHTCKRVIEMFGEKYNVELAEYIYHALLSNALLMWKEFVDEKKAKGAPIRGVYHKNNFINGVLNGYKLQLDENEEKVTSQETEALIHINDPLLEELFNKQYPNMKMSSSSYYNRCGGYSSGYEKGKNMRISRGVGDGASKGVLLSA